MLRRLEAALASESPGHRRRELTFVFVSAGYAGVEALVELSDLVRDALRHYRELRGKPQRWVLVDAAPKILPEIPTRLGNYAADLLARRAVEIRTGTTLAVVEPHAAVVSHGGRMLTRTLPLCTRKMRVVADWTVELVFRRDIAELGTLGRRRGLDER